MSTDVTIRVPLRGGVAREYPFPREILEQSDIGVLISTEPIGVIIIDCYPVDEDMIANFLIINTMLSTNRVERLDLNQTQMADVYNFCEYIGYKHIDELAAMIWKLYYSLSWYRMVKHKSLHRYIFDRGEFYEKERCSAIIEAYRKFPTSVEPLMIIITMTAEPIMRHKFSISLGSQLAEAMTTVKASYLYQKIDLYYTLIKILKPNEIEDSRPTQDQKLDDYHYILDLSADTPLTRFLNGKLRFWLFVPAVLDVCGAAVELFSYNFDNDYYELITAIDPTIDHQYKLYRAHE